MKKARTAGMPWASANGATNVNIPAAASPPTVSTVKTGTSRPRSGAAPLAGADDPSEATPAGSRRQNHAPTTATSAERTNTGRAPKCAAIGSATAGAMAFIARPAPP